MFIFPKIKFSRRLLIILKRKTWGSPGDIMTDGLVGKVVSEFELQ